ncbi:helix-turn-helix domain-containing protein [Brevibacterium linens]|nr:helix-turn-helix transcriptional regulator [Brevibacterium linens]
MSDYFIGENIRLLRKTARLSQAGLAEKMREAGRTHWHQTTVSRVEHNSQPVDDLEDLEALEGILGGNLYKGTPFGSRVKVWGDKVLMSNIESRLAHAQQALVDAQQDLDLISKFVKALKRDERNGDD